MKHTNIVTGMHVHNTHARTAYTDNRVLDFKSGCKVKQPDGKMCGQSFSKLNSKTIQKLIFYVHWYKYLVQCPDNFINVYANFIMPLQCVNPKLFHTLQVKDMYQWRI